MEKEFKFNFSKIELPEKNQILNNNPIIQQAAFFTRFTIPELESAVEGLDKLTESEVELIQRFSNKPNSRKQYSINDIEKNVVFKELGLNGMKSWLNRLELNLADTTQSMLSEYINGEAPDINNQSLPQLIATHKIYNWLKDTEVNVPEESEIIKKIRQLEILEPFQALTTNFKGRVNELESLSDYVDWKPKSSILKSMKGWFRNIIDWYDKPPLMITGIGGAGKSTLIAKFIIDQLEHKARKKLPFIYFDFDKPGLSVSNPMEFVIDALQQLIIQFPQNTSIFNEIKQQLESELLQNETSNNFNYRTISRGSDREVYYENYTKQYREEISRIDIPILVIFDSFEELQYRANTSEINALFNFIQEISKIIPRLRPVFIGRAEVTYGRMHFESIQLEDFDQSAAVAFLESRGMSNTDLGEIIYKKVGGNPLTLKLMVELVQKEKITSAEQIEKITAKMDKTLLQELLVKRNLEHIHDPDTSKIAVPGLLVRRINPDIIKQVLAEPCGFKNLTQEQAELIFIELKKESFLVKKTVDGITFRQDLRQALYKLIVNSNEYKSRDIHNSAVNYYSAKIDPHSRAETLYHSLMRGDNPETLNHLYDESVRPYIENSLSELSDNAYVFLSRKMGIRAEDSKVLNASQLEWENYQNSEIISIIQHGDETTLYEKQIELNQRKKRNTNSVLYFQEAKLESRLGNFKKANSIISIALKEATEKDWQKKIELLILQATIYEYQMNFKAAFETLNNITLLNIPYFRILGDNSNQLRTIVEGRLSWTRLARRQSEEEFTKVLNRIYKFIEPIEKQIYEELKIVTQSQGISNLLPFPYKTYAERIYGKLINGPSFRELFLQMDRSFSDKKIFLHLYKNISSQINNKSDLERILLNRYNLNLKEICEPGVLEVNLIDVVKFIELAESNTEFTRWDDKGSMLL